MSQVLEQRERPKMGADFAGATIAFCAESPGIPVDLSTGFKFTENALTVGSLTLVRNAP